ncbi:hypothetical protein RUND412_002529 [Rhizina undulata]
MTTPSDSDDTDDTDVETDDRVWGRKKAPSSRTITPVNSSDNKTYYARTPRLRTPPAREVSPHDALKRRRRSVERREIRNGKEKDADDDGGRWEEELKSV